MMSYFDKFNCVNSDFALKVTCLAANRCANEMFVFMAPTNERSRLLAKEFETLIESIPEWARSKITVKRATEFQFENGFRVKFVSSYLHVKGLTMNAFFLVGDIKTEDAEYIIPTLTHCSTVMKIKY